MKFHLTKLALLAAAVGATPLLTLAQQAPSTSAVAASSPGKAMVAETVKAQAVIDNIDAASRVIGLKTADGRAFDIIAGPDVKNFAQLKAGDKVNVQYARALSLELKKAGAPTAQSGTTTAATSAAQGAKPGAAAGTQVTAVADVTAIDDKTQTVTLKGPKGHLVELKVRDPGQYKLIKVGDKVEAVYTEALAISVESAK